MMFYLFTMVSTIILSANYIPVQSASKTILFISIPLIGHINPLLRQAIELSQRHDNDYNLYIISCSNIKTYVENNCFNTTVKFLDVGVCQNDTEITLNLKSIAAQTNTWSGVLSILELTLEMHYPKMYEQMLSLIQSNLSYDQQTTIAVVDRLTYAGCDIADHLNIPYIINAASLLPYLGWYDIPLSDYNPIILQDPPQSIHSIGTNLLSRTILPAIRYLSLVYMYFRYDRPFNIFRQIHYNFNDSFHLWSHFHSHMILVNNAFGLEYAQHLPPNIQLTGPMLSTKHPANHYIAQLSNEDIEWIEYDQRPIIYVNFGTFIPLSNEQIHKIYSGLASLEKYRIIWKLNQYELLSEKSSTTFRINRWISSSLGYLAHPNVHLFISHCGINSAYESIWLSKPILCIPILGDQQDMAQRLEDAGVGRWLNKFDFTSQHLKQTIENMLNHEEMLLMYKNMKRIQMIMKFHGGVERTVDFIEIFAEYGIKSMVPLNNFHPWYAYYNLDVYLIWLLVFVGFSIIVKNCCFHRTFSYGKLKTKTS